MPPPWVELAPTMALVPVVGMFTTATGDPAEVNSRSTISDPFEGKDPEVPTSSTTTLPKVNWAYAGTHSKLANVIITQALIRGMNGAMMEM